MAVYKMNGVEKTRAFPLLKKPCCLNGDGISCSSNCLPGQDLKKGSFSIRENALLLINNSDSQTAFFPSVNSQLL